MALLWGGEADTILGMDGDMVVRTMMLGALATAIGAGILGSGVRFGEVTRTIAIWLGIIVALVLFLQITKPDVTTEDEADPDHARSVNSSPREIASA